MSALAPWRDWYHCVVTTYGAWLRGDPRGWRSRHHREHVQGDYRCPPSFGTYAALHRYSQSLMSRAPVHISPSLREPLLTQFVLRLQQEGLQIIIASLDDHHLHLLGKFPDHDPRHWLGIAKKHTSFWAHDNRGPSRGGLWAVCSKPKPILDRQHQLNVYRYILSHQSYSAAIWRLEPASKLHSGYSRDSRDPSLRQR